MTESTRTDVLIIGAGSAGLYTLHLMRQRGLDARIVEAGDGVGGTWFWNRYPGARLHSESHTYQFFFDEELLEEWDWSELFAGQDELERYFNRVADKHDLRRDIDLGTTVTSMAFDEGADEWEVATDRGVTYRARVVVSATGPLSAPIYPDVPGMDLFEGVSAHTARWPREPVDFAGKRVVVIGTGSTGVQVIPQVAREAAHLTVFMRTPNWVIPLNNRALAPEEMAEIRSGYPELHQHLVGTFGGFLHSPGATPSMAYSADELRQVYDDAWAGSGFTKWFGLPHDILSDEQANQHYCAYVAEKIRERVRDPKIAAMLTPAHPFGAKPVECESAGYQGDGEGYYEVYNRDHVDLVSVHDDPIIEILSHGVRTASGVVEADVIVYATGFEAFVGSLNRIDIAGVGGQRLRDRWEAGPQTFLGIGVSGFPNLLIVGGPHGKGGHGNSTRCAEEPVRWIVRLAERVVRGGVRRVEPDPQAEAAWTADVNAAAAASLVSRARSFLFGDNVPGRTARSYVAYLGALPEFNERLARIEREGYPGFVLTS